MAEQGDAVVGPVGQVARDDVDPDMLLAEQRVAGAAHEHGGEHVPLHFEPAVGTHVQKLAGEMAFRVLTEP